jgi:hypothetical protein
VKWERRRDRSQGTQLKEAEAFIKQETRKTWRRQKFSSLFKSLLAQMQA